MTSNIEECESDNKINTIGSLLENNEPEVVNIEVIKPSRIIKTKQPTIYNCYVKKIMPKIKADYPSLSNKDRLRKIAERWKKEKTIAERDTKSVSSSSDGDDKVHEHMKSEPNSSDSDSDSNSEDETIVRRKPTKPDSDDKPYSAYELFIIDILPIIKQKYPNFGPMERMTIINELWNDKIFKSVSSDSEDRTPCGDDSDSDIVISDSDDDMPVKRKQYGSDDSDTDISDDEVPIKRKSSKSVSSDSDSEDKKPPSKRKNKTSEVNPFIYMLKHKICNAETISVLLAQGYDCSIEGPYLIKNMVELAIVQGKNDALDLLLENRK